MTLSYLDSQSAIKPQRLRSLPAAFFKNAADMTFPDIAYVVIDVLLGDEITHTSIKQLINAAYPLARPIAEGAFEAALIRSLRPAVTPVVFALNQADSALANALAASGKAIVFCSRANLMKLPDSATLIEIQGSEAECRSLAHEVAQTARVFTADCAVSTAVNAAKAIFLATRPDPNLLELPQPMAAGFHIAFSLGLPKVEFTITTQAHHRLTSPPNHDRVHRIPPKLDSALRIINASTKVNPRLK